MLKFYSETNLVLNFFLQLAHSAGLTKMKRNWLVAIFLSTYLSICWADLYDGVFTFNAKQYDKALPLLLEAANSGSAQAMGLLARMYNNGWGVKKNHETAASWARLGAYQNDPVSQSTLGYNLTHGLGTKKDYAEALKWFRLAADQGSLSGQDNIGYIYELGLGVTQDFEEAARWYLLTASKGSNFGSRKLEIEVIKKAAAKVVAKKELDTRGEAILRNDLQTPNRLDESVSRKEMESRGEAILQNDLDKNFAIVETAITKTTDDELVSSRKTESEALTAQQLRPAPVKPTLSPPPNSFASNSEKLQSPLNVVMAQRRALVIGNDSYSNVSKLQNAREDARAIATNLQQLGYQVTLKIDLNQKDMKAALRNFKLQIDGGDEVMIFYAGHGVQIGAANYLLPIDILGESEDQIKDDGIQLQKILDDMSERKAKFTLAMIDACRDNPFKSAKRQLGGRGLSPTTAATGQMVVFSAGSGQQALDKVGPVDKNKNGLFTRIFLKEMQKPGISIDRVVRNVRTEVVSIAQSVGHEQVPAIYDQVIGEFYFRR